MEYIEVSDCKMQEGSFRADVNVSVRKKGETKLGTRTEMKNMMHKIIDIFQIQT